MQTEIDHHLTDQPVCPHCGSIQSGPERTVALRKLLEGKDAVATAKGGE